ncbi:hypothetical protein FRX31_025574 [Thalictrum thalictroides]|uniref:Uncharacterized protein n=1 Tax=Thalictrum thalictroides TaxID=46969 RepID=A0A7J6VI97_THATH|nr:hypothetical protein FRX31_025574 [Thalictrum thalictroides]
MDCCEDHEKVVEICSDDVVFSSSGEKVDGKEDDAENKVVECADTCEKQDVEDVVEEKIVESVDTSEKQDSEDVVVESIDTSRKQDVEDVVEEKIMESIDTCEKQDIEDVVEEKVVESIDTSEKQDVEGVVESDDLCSVEFDISKKQAIVEDMTELTPKVIGSVRCGMHHVSVSRTCCCIDKEECLPTTPGKDATTDVVIGSSETVSPGELGSISNDASVEVVVATNTSSKSEIVEHLGELRGVSTSSKPNFTSVRVVENQF